MSRQEADVDVDVLIIGAGINGAGLFRELSEQGVNVLMVEKNDYGAGTSAAPSRLIHGGLKYLETGEFGLVAQSTLERNLLLRNAPHLVFPLPTTIPVFSWCSGVVAATRTLFGSTTAPRSRGALLVKLGLVIYDWYGARHRVMPRHQWHSRSTALKNIPALTPRIVGAGMYYDAKVNAPERLVWELIQDGLTANLRSSALNACTLETISAGKLTFRQMDQEAFAVRPSIVVNAAGPWIDTVNALLGEPSHLIGGTKGSHILINHPKLLQQLKGGMIYFEADDGRVCLVFEYLGVALVGSTDISAEDPDSVQCEDHEVAYFIDSLRSLLPGLEFNSEQIVYSYSGIRPLPATNALEPGLISRDHSSPWMETTAERSFPIVSLVGGKWTTFRGFAEEVADDILHRMERPRNCSTRELAIGGGKEYPVSVSDRKNWIQNTVNESGLCEERIQILFDRYGTTAFAIAKHCSTVDDSLCVADTKDYSLAEIQWLTINEHVVRLADIILRRTTIAVTGRLTEDGLVSIAKVVADELGWSGIKTDDEISTVKERLKRVNRMWRTVENVN